MKVICLLFLSFCPFFSYGQKDTSFINSGFRVFKAYEDFVEGRPVMAKDTLIANGPGEPDKPDGLNNVVWGMQNGKRLLRFYNDTAYLVEDTNGLIIYSISHSDRLQVGGNIPLFR